MWHAARRVLCQNDYADTCKKTANKLLACSPIVRLQREQLPGWGKPSPMQFLFPLWSELGIDAFCAFPSAFGLENQSLLCCFRSANTINCRIIVASCHWSWGYREWQVGRPALMVFAEDDQRESVIWKKEISLGGVIYNLGKMSQVALELYQDKRMDIQCMKG